MQRFRSFRFRRLFAVALGAGFVCASAARGEDAGKAREHYAVGLRAFDLGKYDEAIAEFEAAYRYKDAPGLLYNIAQAYRLSNRPEEAVRYYRTYLERKPDAANRAEAESKIERLASILEERKVKNPALAEAPPPPPGAPSIAAMPRTPALVAPAAAPALRAAPPEAVAAKATAPFWTTRRAGWIATGGSSQRLVWDQYFSFLRMFTFLRALPTLVSGGRNIRFRVTPKAPIIPAATPAAASRAPCARIRPNTARRLAPSAMRTPISCVRCETEYARTP